MSGLKICFAVADQSLQRTKSIGILNVSVGLLEAMAREPGVEKLLVLGNPELSLRSVDGIKLSVTHYNLPCQHKLARIFCDQWQVYRAAAKSGCDWLFLPKGYASFIAVPPIKMAAYVHDTMLDFYRAHYPGAISRAEALYFQLGFAATLRHASVIFTNSDFSRREILRCAKKLGVAPPPVLTAGIGFSRPAFKAAAKENYILVLVSKWPHKLTRRAVDYLRRWQQQSAFSGTIHLLGQLPDGLTISGLPHWQHSQRVPDASYIPMLRNACALVYFSEYEGFGMPPIEAILQGTPAVYSRIPALEESSQGCGFAFDNASADGFNLAMAKALACGPGEIERWAELLLRRHSWQKVGQQVMHGLTTISN